MTIQALKPFDDFISRSLGALDEARNQGRLIAGVYCIFAPSEMIRAVGMLPVGLCGKKAEPIATAEETLPANLCPLIKSSYGYAVGDTCPFFSIADCIVGETTCDGKKKMYEYLGRLKPLHLMRLPDAPEEPHALSYWLEELRRFKTFLEDRSGNPVTDAALRREISAQNKVRRLLKRLVEVNRAVPPPLTGNMLLPVLESKGFFVDGDAYRTLLENLVTALENHAQASDPKLSGRAPRILLTGTPIGKGCEKVLTLIEAAGAHVVAMENCTGLKGILRQVDEDDPDPLTALARHYLSLPCACMSPNRGRLESVDELVRVFGVAGVVDLTWQACHTYNIESAGLKRHIEEAHGLPVLHLETDYSEADTGQLKVRIEAFLEMAWEQCREIHSLPVGGRDTE